jgi:hypothetical protein
MKRGPKPGAPGAGRPCHVCRHKDVARIELACASGRSHYDIAAEFGISRHAVNRHWRAHVTDMRKAILIGGPVAIAKLAERAAEEDRSLLDYLSILRSELFHLFLAAKERGLTFDAASIAQRLLSTLEAIGRLNGQLRQAGITINNVNAVSSGPTTLVLNSPEVIKLQSTIISALSNHPEARGAVIAALRSLDAQSIGQGLNGCHGPPLAVSGPPVIEAVNA